MILEHVNITVSDAKRSAKFYADLLGLEVRWQGETAQGWPAIHVGDQQSYLALFQSPNPTSADENYARVGLNHFGFVVDDLEAAKARLLELGISPKAEHNYEPGKRLYFFDPDGIEVELIEYTANTGDHGVAEDTTGSAR